MTPPEKAIELLYKFCGTTDGYYKSRKNIKNAKRCAIVCLDELIKLENDFDNYYPQHKYWQQVKEEINKL